MVDREVRHDGERHGAAGAGADVQILEPPDVASRRLIELDPDRNETVAGVELGKIGVDVAERGDADRLRQRFGGDAEIGGDLTLRFDAKLWPVELGGRDRVLDRRNRAHLAGELVRRVVDFIDVGPGEDEREVALSVVVDEPIANVGRIGEHGADPHL